MNLNIRMAKVEEAKAILDINISSWKSTYKNIFPSEFLNNLCKDREAYKKALNKNKEKIEKGIYCVALVDNEVCGFVVLENQKIKICYLVGKYMRYI